MDEIQAKQTIERLRAEIAKHERLYRIENAPVISDDEFDSLMRRLRALEAEYPQLSRSDSPSSKIGSDLSEGFATVRHISPMLSLDNVFNLSELEDFDERLRKVLGMESSTLEYCVEPKIDGAGISAVYENGNLVRLLTRGNGEEGDDITANAFAIKNLPLRLKGVRFPKLLEIRGEAYMTRAEFERLKGIARLDAMRKALIKKNKKLERGSLLSGFSNGPEDSLGEDELRDIERNLPANPRNLAAGTLKLLDKSVLEARSLMAIFYSLGAVEGFDIKEQSELPRALEAWGLPAVNWFAMARGTEEAFEKISELEAIRNDFPYNTDGAVLKLNDCSLHAAAGLTSHAPRWAVAWKYRAQRAETVLDSITLQVGRTGVVTPVAELKPIYGLSGTTVSRATLHNAGYIAEKDIRVGDTVVVEKAGEIIPAVLGVVLSKRPESSVPFEFPKTCPKCGADLKKFGEKMLFRCPNMACPPQVRGRIEHFADRDCMDIRGLGKSVVDKLVENLGVKDPSDIYFLTKEKLLTLDKFKEKSAENLLAAIEKSKKAELWRLIFGLGILEIGEQFAKELARKFSNLDELMNADMETIKQIDGMGAKSKDSPAVRALSIKAFFDDPHNRAIIEKLRGAGLNFSSSNETSGKLSGKIFVFTGTLKSMGRSEAKVLVERLGGKTAGSVSSKTDFLVSDGAFEGEKFSKAKELGIKIIGEKEFLEMVEDGNSKYTPSENVKGEGQMFLF